MDNKKFRMTILILSVCLVFSTINPLPAATFTVNTFADTVDVNPGDGVPADADGYCSLRAAVMEANALYGPDTIVLPAGTFKITLEGSREDHCETGDLDIFSNLTILGAGMYETIIDGNQLDRVLDIPGKINVSIFGLTIANGHAPNGKEGTSVDLDGEDGEAGGGIKNNNGILTLQYCRIVNNCAGSGGGGYWPLEGEGGDGAPGGGIYNSNGELYLLNCAISNNSAGNGGSGEFDGNGGGGGGICTKGTSATEVDYYGIGHTTLNDISTTEGYLLMENCLISANRSGHGGWYSVSGDGGGIYGFNCDIKFLNCSISGNHTGTALDIGYGGGIFSNRGKLSLLHCTLTNNWIGNQGDENSYGYGGGICGNPYMKSTILTNNFAGANALGQDCFGTIHSLGYNLIGDLNGCTIEGITTGNLIGQDAQLGPLADNGGPTFTHALAIGSPAIDAADPDNFPETDQRGIPRPADGNGDGIALPDIGAYERSFPAMEIVTPRNNDTVRGIVAIQVEVSYAEGVEFYIDGHKTFTAETEPFDFDWDTTTFFNGKHRIKAAAVDMAGQRAEDEMQVQVNNVIIRLNASRQEEKGWLVRKLYGKLVIDAENTGAANVSRYVIERKEGDGSYHTVKEIPASEFRGNTYIYNDLGLNTRTAYTYRVTALDGSGMIIGRSQEQAI